MKRFLKVFGITVLALSLFVTGAFAYGGPPAKRPFAQPQINTDEAVVVTGIIESMDRGEYYTVKLSDGKVIRVGFGPYWYLEKIGLSLNVGDSISMTGVYISDRFIPISVTKDGKVFTLRDKDGRPLWSGRNRRENKSFRTIQMLYF